MEQLSLFNVQEIEITYRNQVPPSHRPKISGTRSAVDILRPFFENYMEYKEAFFIVLLNNANRVLGISRISEGGITGTYVDIRFIFQVALKANAVSIILAHNHPSGTLMPSDPDLRLTKKIVQASQILDIKILDHLILTRESHFSFAEECLL